ncbi:MAG: hypothetical protein R3B48_18650 [Kofleriaceae bacterium]
MSPQLLLWFKVVHIAGFVLWVAGLWAGLWLLKAHLAVDAASRPAMVGVERKVGASMDAGATLAMVAGFVLALGGPINAFKTGGWLHAKLAVVVLGVLSIHGVIRVKMRKVRNGDLSPLPGWLTPVLLAAVAVIIALGAHPMLLRN